MYFHVFPIGKANFFQFFNHLFEFWRSSEANLHFWGGFDVSCEGYNRSTPLLTFHHSDGFIEIFMAYERIPNIMWVGFSSPKKTTNHQGSTGHCSHTNKQQLKLVPGGIFVGNLAGFYRWTLRVQDDDAEVRHDWRAVVKQQRHRCFAHRGWCDANWFLEKRMMIFFSDFSCVVYQEMFIKRKLEPKKWGGNSKKNSAGALRYTAHEVLELGSRLFSMLEHIFDTIPGPIL